VDSPVKKPVASEMPRCAPPHTFGAGEEPWEGESSHYTISARFVRIVRLGYCKTLLLSLKAVYT